MSRFYVDSPCGHGKLVDVVPYGENDARLGRFGLIYVVARDRDGGKIGECCSFSEGEYASCEEALAGAEKTKALYERGLYNALSILQQARTKIYAEARVAIADLLEFERRTTPSMVGAQLCEQPLCFEYARYWWSEQEEGEKLACEEHAKKLGLVEAPAA